MNRRRLEVQFCVLNDITRRYGPHPTSDLLGVDYFRPVSADTEFPYTIPRLDLFVRFLVARLGPTEIAVRVRRLKDDGTNGERVAELRTVVPFDPADTVMERVFRLVNVPCTGEGRYAVRVCRHARRGWKGLRWRVLGTDYFLVQR
jgi:hypothetical protein